MISSSSHLLPRTLSPGNVQAITDPWPVKDIVYVSIIGLVMLAAFLEWFLWLAAFLYCLVKVYQKADTWSVKVIAVIMMIAFFALRFVPPHLWYLVTFNTMQSSVSPGHGCNITATATSHTVFSTQTGLLFTMVRILDFCRTAHYSLAILCISACHS